VRNYVHQMLLLDEWARCGCQVEFLELPMGQDPHDQLLLQIRSAVAEYERTLIAERMRRGRQRKLQAGVLLPWTRAPYGYRLDPERPRDPAGVRVEEAEAAVVRDVYAHYLEPGGSLAGVAKRLCALGVPTPTGKRCWHPNTIRLLLTNPAYTGQVYAGRSRARPAQGRWSALRPVRPGRRCAAPLPPAAWIPVAPVPALVSQEQFDQVQAKLAQNQQFARRHNTAHPYLLRALVSCGVCRLGCVGRCVHPGVDTCRIRRIVSCETPYELASVRKLSPPCARRWISACCAGRMQHGRLASTPCVVGACTV
jgi:site-specific DNA recombinase